ncbi:phenylacetaldoxime dehydratase family protein [Sphingobium sp. BHU LFT2]|uniref:aliphatic aldoxime dehydratase n=1 Tax=Sphingobium sp. BHU LFT2 TaxID=2807634 RepID=UPI001BE5852B|nr:phenylacetaldoxime dehydratase family protein [Sphingobium sp. BHU LFT2]MBT2246737.1 phenylacetaldoxime dehydratase family protein [Sphingobium sp. BHU LFT2]
MESAIDTHLQCPRTLSRRVADDYKPPFPMWVARADPSLKQVVMGHFGVQSTSGDEQARAASLDALRHIVASFQGADGPGHFDLVDYADTDGHDNRMAIAYWTDPAAFARWETAAPVRDWWQAEARLSDGIGYFREIIAPRVEQFETLYGFQDAFPGVGAVMDRGGSEVEEHGYWGSMRDRIPASQTDWMAATGDLGIASGDPQTRGRVVIAGHDNLCLIRSGQDWEEADAEERALYLDEIEPTLRAGMDFLRDEGGTVGCYSNRYVRHIDLDGRAIDQSFDLGLWRSLDLLERWAESHPTHLRIFVTFFRVATSLQKLRLYHEVLVADAADQHYEYINCHPNTGLMRDARSAAR